MFLVKGFDGLSDTDKVPITSFSVWIEIQGLSLKPALFTDDIMELIGVTLGTIEQVDKIGNQNCTIAKFKVIHSVTDPIREAFPL